MGRNLLRLISEVFFKYSNANKQLSSFYKELEYVLPFMSSSCSVSVTLSFYLLLFDIYNLATGSILCFGVVKELHVLDLVTTTPGMWGMSFKEKALVFLQSVL